MQDPEILSYTEYLYDYLRYYRPIAVIDRIPIEDPIADVDYIVLQYMAKYGIESIRGGSYTSIYIKPQYAQIQWMIDEIRSWIRPQDPLYDYFQEKWRRDRADEIFQNELRINDDASRAKDEAMYYFLTHDSMGNEIFWQDYLYDITPEFVKDSHPHNESILNALKEKYTEICLEDSDDYRAMLYTIINHIEQYAFHLSTHIYEDEMENTGPMDCGIDVVALNEIS